MKVNPGVFRTYDIRGKYGEEISKEFATQLAHAFLVLYPHMKKIVVARDAAPHSPVLAEAVKQGREQREDPRQSEGLGKYQKGPYP